MIGAFVIACSDRQPSEALGGRALPDVQSVVGYRLERT
jgi:hypothetical protein